MTNDPGLSARLSDFLDAAVQSSVASLEKLPPDEVSIIPWLLLFGNGESTISVVNMETNTAAVQAAREMVRSQAAALEAYVLSYCVQRVDDDGAKFLALILEAGERGAPTSFIYVQPYERDAQGKVVLLSDRPSLYNESRPLI
jgi:hypothetical protein